MHVLIIKTSSFVDGIHVETDVPDDTRPMNAIKNVIIFLGIDILFNSFIFQLRYRFFKYLQAFMMHSISQTNHSEPQSLFIQS